MERLGHCAEILAQACRLAAGDGKRARGGLDVEAEQGGGGRGGGEGPACRRGVEAGLVVARGDGFGDLALDLDAEVIGQHHVGAGGTERFAHGERSGQGRGGRMGEQAVNAIRGHGELRVVIVVGVDADAVGEGREARGHLAAGTDDGCRARRQTKLVEMAANQRTALRDRAGQRQPDAVEDGLLAERNDVVGQILYGGGDDEIRHIVGQAGRFGDVVHRRSSPSQKPHSDTDRLQRPLEGSAMWED